MSFNLVFDGKTKDERPMKNVYADTMKGLMEKSDKIVIGEADIGNGIWAPDFFEMQKKFGDRFYDVGIQEANMVGVAAGMSVTGLVPYIHSFAPFVARRACDIIFISCSYAKLNVRVIGSDPGITTSFNGGTHMSFEDVGIVRGFPQMTVIDISDGAMLEDVLKQTAEAYGMFYIRFARSQNYDKIYSYGSTFKFGKANILQDGNDVTIIAAGIMVPEALRACETLKSKGVSARVIDIFTIKPIDADLIVESAAKTGAIVTAENHNIINGLGSAVAEVLVKNKPCPVAMVGAQDEFGEVGSMEYLAQRFKLTADEIVNQALAVIKRK